MFKVAGIRNSTQTVDFLNDLKEVLRKHEVVIVYGEHHIEFMKPGVKKIAQCFVAGGISPIK